MKKYKFSVNYQLDSGDPSPIMTFGYLVDENTTMEELLAKVNAAVDERREMMPGTIISIDDISNQ